MQANVDAGGTSNTGSPTVCGGVNSGTLTTTIEFLDYIGTRPPMWLNANITSSSKLFGNHSHTKLNYQGSTPVLRFATKHTLTCQICTGCSGTLPKLYFMFGNNISSSISVSVDNAATIKTKLLTISDFNTNNNIWPNFDIDVTFSGTPSTICDDTNIGTTVITFYSDYGNIHGLTFTDNTANKITMTTNEGKGKLYECSNNGVCNRQTGQCSCYTSKIDNTLTTQNHYYNQRNEYYYKLTNSDGSATNTLGSR